MATAHPHVQVTLEFGQANSPLPSLRWQRTTAADPESPFLLLGRAFDMAREHSPASFAEALSAFLKGAMLDKQDLIDAME